MSMEVVEEHVNSLLHRREAKLVVHHQGQGTPDRITVRKLAMDHFKAGLDQVYVRSIATRTGGSSALCVVEVYEDPKSAETSARKRSKTCSRKGSEACGWQGRETGR